MKAIFIILSIFLSATLAYGQSNTSKGKTAATPAPQVTVAKASKTAEQKTPKTEATDETLKEGWLQEEEDESDEEYYYEDEGGLSE